MTTRFLERCGNSRCILNFGQSASSIPNQTGIAVLLDAATLISRYSSRTDYEISYQLILESLEVSANISSIALAQVPSIAPEDTPSERAIKIQQMDARFAKIGVQMLIDNGDGAGWIANSVTSLQNQGGEYYDTYLNPFLSTKDFKPIDQNYKIGFKSVDLGNGLLRGNDYVIFQCSYTLQVGFLQPYLIDPGKDGVWQQTLSLAAGEQRILQIPTCKLGYALFISSSTDCRLRYYQSLADAQTDLLRATSTTAFIQGLCFEMALGTGIDSTGNISTILSQGFRPNTTIGNRDSPRKAIGYLTVSNPLSRPAQVSISLSYTAIQ